MQILHLAAFYRVFKTVNIIQVIFTVYAVLYSPSLSDFTDKEGICIYINITKMFAWLQ